MQFASYARHGILPVVIQHTVWLYLRATLSYRDVEDLLAERGLDVLMRRSGAECLNSARYTRNLHRRWPPPNDRWHLDEMVAMIGGPSRVSVARALGREARSPYGKSASAFASGLSWPMS